MGQLKDQKLNEEREFDVTDYDLKFIQALNQGGVAAYNYYRSLVTLYLAGLATERWEYPKDAVLDFEVDQENKKIKVKPAIDKS